MPKIFTYTDLIKKGYDPNLIADTQPQGNFKIYPNYIQIGSGYGAFVDINRMPDNGLNNFYLSQLLNDQRFNIIGFISVSTVKQEEITKQINKSIARQLGEANDETLKPVTRFDAQQQANKIYKTYMELKGENEIFKEIYVHLFIYNSDLTGLYKDIGRLKRIYSDYSMNNMVDEQQSDYQSIYTPTKQIKNLANRRQPITIASRDLGHGYPFDYTSLADDYGMGMGSTLTNGQFTFNTLLLKKGRSRAFSLIAGQPGYGKTNLSMMLEDQVFHLGNNVINFDVAGQFTKLTEEWNGVVIDIADTSQKVNMFEIQPTVTKNGGKDIDVKGSFTKQMSTIKTIVRSMNKDLTDTDMDVLNEYLLSFYDEEKDMYSYGKPDPEPTTIIGLKPREYPTLSEFISYLTMEMSDLSSNGSKIDNIKIGSMNNLLRVLNKMEDNYKDIFEGETTIPQDLRKAKVITFNMKGIKEQSQGVDENIFQAQFYNYLSLASSYIVLNGEKQHSKIENGYVDDKQGLSMNYYYLNIDEAQHYLSPEFPRTAQMIANMMEEMRKNYCAITLVFPTLKDLLLSGNETNNDYNRALSKIFGLIQYFHFFNLNSKDVNGLKEHFENDTKISPKELNTISELPKYEVLTVIDQDKSYRWKVAPTEKQSNLYSLN